MSAKPELGDEIDESSRSRCSFSVLFEATYGGRARGEESGMDNNRRMDSIADFYIDEGLDPS